MTSIFQGLKELINNGELTQKVESMSDNMSDSKGRSAAGSARGSLASIKNDNAVLSNRVNPQEVIEQFKKKIAESAAKLEACKNAKYPNNSRMNRLSDIILELNNSIKICEERIKER